MKDHIVVAGGAGFIGRNLVEELVRLNQYHLTVIDNLSGLGSEVPSTLDRHAFHEIDLGLPIAKTIKLPESAIWVLLAAKSSGVGYFDSHPASMLDENVRIISSVFRAALERSATSVVYVSSSCVFDDSNGHALTESKLI